jgi:transcription initiation factor TFIIIB Brf1 subunit/transcription initiation factor TFIIB
MESTKRAYIKISGNGAGKYYNTQQDGEITQKEGIREQLFALNNSYTGNQFPKSVLNNVVEQYAQIQRLEVKRGNHKNEILATLIYFDCINEGAERKRRDIAEFMQLNTGGFAKGEAVVRNFVANGDLKIILREESINGYAEKYMEILELEPNGRGISQYLPMIEEIILRAKEKNLDTNSFISSKVISVIWLIIIKCGFNIKMSQLEEKCDKTKTNTIKKFYDLIIKNREVFVDIMEKYNII